MIKTKMESIQKTYRIDETELVSHLVKEVPFSDSELQQIQDRANIFIHLIRKNRLEKKGIDAFLQAYDLSSDEGIALMTLAEALLRIPDQKTRDKLIRDKLANRDWEEHLGKSHSWFVNAATWGLKLTGHVLNKEQSEKTYFKDIFKKWLQKTSEPIIRTSIAEAMKILGKQFVMAETIEDALSRAIPMEKKGYLYSYDMLGEAAKTEIDAENYFNAYFKAITEVGKNAQNKGPILSPGISVKLSALHPRYEWVKREKMFIELLPRIKALALQAKKFNIGFTIDAEEADRLELSLLLLEKLMHDSDLANWKGLGLAVQAYQKRAPFVIDWLIELANQTQRHLMIRLVKGAYWDSEIKWTQEKGLKNYPVFTRKVYTDVAFLGCAKKLLNAKEYIFPQFATHNAFSVAAIFQMASKGQAFEFQCLHGMGESLYDNIVGPDNLNVPCRIYAPVGGHENLLAYLVRRLLENGANSSFVNQILDENIPIQQLIENPVQKAIFYEFKPHPLIPLPVHLFPSRPNSKGMDLTDTLDCDPFLKKIEHFLPKVFSHPLQKVSKPEIETIIENAHHAFSTWSKQSIELRAQYLKKMAELLEENKAELIAILIREGGKTVQDALSEVREAIDYCWYYRDELSKTCQIMVLPGPTGEHNQLTLHGRGVIACISPWNFPLAIFLGQIVGALAAGNTVIAKPASQTPFIAAKTISLLHAAGFPKQVVQLLVGSGSTVGDLLVTDPRIQGILFTGSTDTARGINQKLAARSGPIVPFIAETGGQNVMIVDSSALSEQVVTDVLTSAFNSAGQRCSALRVLFLQEEIAERTINMLKGAMAELKIGDPFELSTDVGPVIDQKATEPLLQHSQKMQQIAKPIYECSLPDDLPELPRGKFFAPRAFEIENIDVLTNEVFGPILHVVRYRSNDLDKVIESINGTGYGLTLGIHSRIDETVQAIYSQVHVGNIYVNRNMIGAVVGVQPFGGEGLSGTGPKAGGPHMLPRLCVERTLSINTTAAGGNTTLMSLKDFRS